jgi:hypothetical protein
MVVKQISKSRKEKEFVSDIDFDVTDSEKPQSKIEDLDKMPKDKEYTDISEEIRKKALEEEGINLDSEERNENNTFSEQEKNNLKDSKKEEPKD